MNILTNKLKKILAIITVVVVLTSQNVMIVAYAEETTDAPEETATQNITPTPTAEPEKPKEPEAPKTPEQPESPEQPKTPEKPKSPEQPKKPGEKEAEDSAYDAYVAERRAAAIRAYMANRASGAYGNTGSTSPSQNQTGGVNNNGSANGATVNTGDATNNASVLTTGNNNLSAGVKGNNGGSASVSNSGNGALSNNSGSATSTSANNTTQNNSAGVQNELNQSSVTGNNSTSFNNGDSSISTGNANVTGTVVTSVNTNVDGVAVAEFNIVDDHVGDIILDYNANCVSGCAGTPGVSASNTNNGAGSSNDASTSDSTTNSTDQTNNATVGNTLNLSADSGNNDASFNTGGDSSIVTGDANVSANAVTFANNNIAGNIVYGVVNIFGNLIGDIIIPQSMIDDSCATCGGSTTATNSGNGAGSDNNASASNTYTNDINQFNTANIDNSIVLNGNTGGNDTESNTGGNSTVETGDVNLTANILNIANTNIVDGTMWLVIVNEAGKWIGKIMGAPEGQNYAGSQDIEFDVAADGSVTAGNNNNGTGSDNSATSNQTTNNTTNQTNNADIQNTLNLSANTGNNDASFNTGGNSNIQTGDATIIANIVNFVNNNIVGDGKLVVTVVNVFGSWLGDLVTPGQEKDIAETPNEDTTAHIGGSSSNTKNKESKSKSSNSHSNNNTSDENNNAIVSSISDTDINNTPRVYAANIGGSILTGISDAQTKVASAVKGSTASDEIVATANAVTINLAWLLVLLPLALAATKIGKRLAARRAARV